MSYESSSMSTDTLPYTTPTEPPSITTTQGFSNLPAIGIAVGVVGGVILIFLVVIAIVCIYCLPKKRKEKRRLRKDAETAAVGLETLAKKRPHGQSENQYIGQKKKNNLEDYQQKKLDSLEHEVPSANLVAESYINEEVFNTKKKINPRNVLKRKMKKELKLWEIDPKTLTTKEMIGKGQFGVVYKGILFDKQNKNQPSIVAVKTISGDVSRKELSRFLAEALLMRNFEHQNVLRMKGVVIKDNLPLVVMPYMAKGDLKGYISNTELNLTVKELITFAYHVVQGMTYLAMKGFVHRDLAARNCMLDEEMIVKVADFGLSRDIYDTEYYKPEDKNIPLPVRWMAVESLPPKDMRFTTKSDVWSFGILIWELFTRGQTPYPSLDNMSVIKYIQKGERLQPPSHTPADISALMGECCNEAPDKRPTFQDLCNTLDRILSSDGAERDYQNIVN